MSSPHRMRVAVALIAVAAAGLVIGVTELTDHGTGAAATTVAKPRPGSPPLALDLGLRDDAEANALRRADRLLDAGKREQAAAIFERYGSLQAQMGAAIAAWGPGALQRVQALAAAHPRSGFAQFHLGLAMLWAGRNAAAIAAFKAAVQREPDSASAVSASTLLHPKSPPRLPFFTPSFGAPAAIASLRPVRRQYRALELAARRPDAHAKILWGVALQRLGRPVSAARQFDAAARLAPNDPEALTASAVGRFTKDKPVVAFSRLGPLSKRFPRSVTVRFHLGLLLVWIGDLEGGKKQIELAAAADEKSPLRKEVNDLLAALEKH